MIGTGEERSAAGRASARGPEAAPIDLAHLARQTFGSVDLEREVLRLFVGQSDGLVDRIAAAAAVDERAAAAHRLKGSARAIGAERIGRLAEALETAVDPAEVTLLVADVRRATAAVARFVADRLAAGG